MKTRLIPREEWTRFFDRLSQRQEGWQVELEVFGGEIGDQIEGRQLFLTGITAEVNEHGEKIEIMMAQTPTNHVTHIVHDPTQVDLEQTDLGIDAAVRIKSKDELVRILHLR